MTADNRLRPSGTEVVPTSNSFRNELMTRRSCLFVASLALVVLTLSSAVLGHADGPTPVVQAPATGSVCLLSTTDPTPGEKSLYNYAGGNPTPDYSVQIGKGSIVAIPHSPKGAGAGVLITGIPLADSYFVRIRHQGKPLESFRFRFEEKDGGRLCLFLNELYLTWQLWPAHQYPPACKCKGAKVTPWVGRPH